MKRIAILMLTGVLVLSGADHAQAGGFLKRLFGKRQCAPATACKPAPGCEMPMPTCASCSAPVPSCCGTIPAELAGPVVGEAAKKQLMPCFDTELPEQANCMARWNSEKRCCDDIEDPETRALCKIAAYVRYLYCEGEIEPMPSGSPCRVGKLLIDCGADNFGCGSDLRCYYAAYPCCVYGIGCEGRSGAAPEQESE